MTSPNDNPNYAYTVISYGDNTPASLRGRNDTSTLPGAGSSSTAGQQGSVTTQGGLNDSNSQQGLTTQGGSSSNTEWTKQWSNEEWEQYKREKSHQNAQKVAMEKAKKEREEAGWEPEISVPNLSFKYCISTEEGSARFEGHFKGSPCFSAISTETNKRYYWSDLSGPTWDDLRESKSFVSCPPVQENEKQLVPGGGFLDIRFIYFYSESSATYCGLICLSRHFLESIPNPTLGVRTLLNHFPNTFEELCIGCSATKKKDCIGASRNYINSLELDRNDWSEEEITCGQSGFQWCSFRYKGAIKTSSLRAIHDNSEGQ